MRARFTSPSLPRRVIVDKIDRDRDGYVTEKELEDWVRHVANRSAPPSLQWGVV